MSGANDTDGGIERRLHERLLLARRVEGDLLVLDDATLGAALDGSRPLMAGERAALQASPLTARRLRQLALERRAAAVQDVGHADTHADIYADSHGAPQHWRASRGMLRAASSAGQLAPLRTDDGWWTLHFVPADEGWRAILQLAPQAPFAAGLLAARAHVAVLDGAGSTILQADLDVDGECEAAWPHAQAPGAWLQAHEAAFSVERR